MGLAKRCLVDRIKRWLGIEAIQQFNTANKAVIAKADKAIAQIWDFEISACRGDLSAAERIARDQKTEQKKTELRDVG